MNTFRANKIHMFPLPAGKFCNDFRWSRFTVQVDRLASSFAAGGLQTAQKWCHQTWLAWKSPIKNMNGGL